MIAFKCWAHGGSVKIIGKILWWDRRDQNGIIVNATGNEFYFDISVVEGTKATSLKSGAIVQFSIQTKFNGLQAAKAVFIPPSKSKNKLEREFARNLQLSAEI